jgi:murein DD-endopeptidase MepM/ murein hydrolase activator NlpD
MALTSFVRGRWLRPSTFALGLAITFAFVIAIVIAITSAQGKKYLDDSQHSEALERNDDALVLTANPSADPALPLGHPLPFKTNPSSLYGWRVDPFTQRTKHHHGVDFSVPLGTTVLASGSGTVIASHFDPVNGHFIEIAHGSPALRNGYISKYAHLHTRVVNQGDSVKLGQIIGTVGSTGRSTSPHLHYEIAYRGNTLNPLNYMGQPNPVMTVENIPASSVKPEANAPQLQRILFIRNSGVEYRLIDPSKPQPF